MLQGILSLQSDVKDLSAKTSLSIKKFLKKFLKLDCVIKEYTKAKRFVLLPSLIKLSAGDSMLYFMLLFQLYIVLIILL